MTNLKISWLARLATVTLAISVGAACDDDSDGGTQLTGGNTQQVAQQSAASVDSILSSFFDDNDALTSLDVLGGLILGVTGSPLIAPNVPRPNQASMARAAEYLAASVQRLQELQGTPEGDGLRANIPSNLLGVTCIWDPTNVKWIIDPNDPGLAPPNGIRFRLYTINQATQLPALPLDDIGFIDITDDSSPTTIDVGLVAEIDGVGTLVNYNIMGSFGQTSFTLMMDGFVGDGTDKLDFNFTVAGSTDSFSSSFNLILGTTVVSFEFTGSSDGSGSNTVLISDATADVFILFTFNFDQFGNVAPGSGVTVNDELVANITGTVDNAVLTGADGTPLTDAELSALAGLFNAVGDLFEVMAELFFFGIGVTGSVFIG